MPGLSRSEEILHSRERSRGRSRIEQIKKFVESFGETGNVDNLFGAYELFKSSEEEDFLRLLSLGLGFKERNISREFSDYELEVKLGFHFSGDPDPKTCLTEIRKRIPSYGLFLSLGNVERVDSENHYFGDDKGEGLVIVDGGRRINLKRKQGRELVKCDSAFIGGDYQYEDNLLKRKEEVSRDQDVGSVIKAILDADNLTYRGSVFRKRARTDVFSPNTGRIYTLVFDNCSIERGDEGEVPRMVQAEAEYVGYIPGPFKSLEMDSEKQIGKELLELGGLLKVISRNVELSDGSKVWFPDFTKKTKYDFLMENSCENG